MNATTGSRLREERVKLGFSQEKMSELGGVKRLSQTNYETDKRTPDGDYLIKIAEIGADVQYILTGKRSLTENDDGNDDGDDAANDANISPKKRELMRLLERLDENALDDAIYSTKKLVENCEMKMMLQKLTAQQGQQQRMAA